MAKSELNLNPHDVYMGLTFRPLIRPDGTVARVGVQAQLLACVEPECYPNLITAAPALYQVLALVLARLDRTTAASQDLCEAIEAVMSFAQNGYLHRNSIEDIISRLKK